MFSFRFQRYGRKITLEKEGNFFCFLPGAEIENLLEILQVVGIIHGQQRGATSLHTNDQRFSKKHAGVYDSEIIPSVFGHKSDEPDLGLFGFVIQALVQAHTISSPFQDFVDPAMPVPAVSSRKL